LIGVSRRRFEIVAPPFDELGSGPPQWGRIETAGFDVRPLFFEGCHQPIDIS